MLDLIFAAVVSVVASQAPMPAAPPAPPTAEQAQAAPQAAAPRAERRRIQACTIVRLHGSRIAHQQCYNPAVLPADDVVRRRENAQQWVREAQQTPAWR